MNPLATLFALLACCSLSTADSPAPHPLIQEEINRVCTEGGTFEMHAAPGAVFAFFLPSNPSTGYCWTATGGGTIAGVDLEPVQAEAHEEGGQRLVGAPSAVLVTITALRPGNCTITLRYARPWEKEAEPASTLRMKLHVVSKQ